MPSPLSRHALEGLPETIDRAISYCLLHRLLYVRRSSIAANIPCYSNGFLKVGHFLFDLHEHSTGNSLKVYVINDDDALCIIDETYWFSPRYAFNESTRLSGKWDKALGEAMQAIRKAKEDHMANKVEQESVADAKRKQTQEERVSKFESLF